jgi:hypothetical protein
MAAVSAEKMKFKHQQNSKVALTAIPKGLPEVIPGMSGPTKQVDLCKHAVFEGDSVKCDTYPSILK